MTQSPDAQSPDDSMASFFDSHKALG